LFKDIFFSPWTEKKKTLITHP